ncbi:MAG: GTP-binding protein [Chloroflexota bacterium]|nr:GTP-binding protein [Chloroflexota bacterium]
MDMLRIATAGSVDDGKSTLIGRLLYDSKAIYEDVLDSAEQHSRRQSTEYFNLALLTDGLRSEREQGITIDVAYRYFSTPKRKFILADTPGHVQYTRNMVTGASTADIALIIVDARNGVVEQLRRHALIGALLGIKHFVFCINKMDLVDFREDIFRPIQDDLHSLLIELGIKSHHFIPISAIDGDNVVHSSKRMPWYVDDPLVRHLEKVQFNDEIAEIPFRMPVQYVIRPLSNELHDYRGYAGTIQSGQIEVGQQISVMPSGAITLITDIDRPNGAVSYASESDAVTIRIAGDLDISRGDMLSSPDEKPTIDNQFEATVCWMTDKTSLKAGMMVRMKHTTHTVRALILDVEFKVDVNDLSGQLMADELVINEIGQVSMKTTEPLIFDEYLDNRATGSFILIDVSSKETVGSGMIGRPACFTTV